MADMPDLYLLSLAHKSFPCEEAANTNNRSLAFKALGKHFECEFINYLALNNLLHVKICECASTVNVECKFACFFLKLAHLRN